MIHPGKEWHRHLKGVHESYVQHLKFAMKCGSKMAINGVACMLHGLVPFIFTHAASDCIKEMYMRFIKRDKNSLVIDKKSKRK